MTNQNAVVPAASKPLTFSDLTLSKRCLSSRDSLRRVLCSHFPQASFRIRRSGRDLSVTWSTAPEAPFLSALTVERALLAAGIGAEETPFGGSRLVIAGQPILLNR